MTEHSKDTATLNTLIGTLLDSVEGYRKSAEDSDNPQLAQRFLARSQERQQAVATLQVAVTRLGGKAEDDATLLGGIHRAFVDLKAAVTGRDEQAIVNEVERGEDYLKGKFLTALKNVELSADARSAIEQAWNSVQAGHDEMSQLKHRLEGYKQGANDAQHGAVDTQQYAAESNGARQTGATVSSGGTGFTSEGGAQQSTLTGTDTYQQQAGGYPGTIGSERTGSGTL
ncbi:MAG: PA2169 family four-helix-bundle protein [Novosphingobium sp.]